MMKILIISFLVWLGPIRAELQVINTTVITFSTRGCLQSGRVLQGFLEISDPNESLSEVPQDGLCPNGTILIGPSVNKVYPNETLIVFGLEAKCAKNGRIYSGLVQSAQQLIPASNCNATTGVFMEENSALQTVVSDQFPYIPELPVRFNRSVERFCARLAVVTEGVVISGQNPKEAINESCPLGQFLLKPGVVYNNQVVLNSSTCITTGFLTNGRVFIQGEQALFSRSFMDGAICFLQIPKVLLIRNGVIILLELPLISTTATMTSTLFLTPLPLSSTLYSTVTSTVLLTRTQAYPSYPDYGSKQQHGYGSSMRPSGYLPRRDKSFRFYPFDHKPKMNVDALIKAKINNRLGNY